VTVIVTDDFNLASEGTVWLNVTRPAVQGPTIAAFIAAPPSIVLGESTQILAIVNGGTAPWNATFTGLPPGCTSANTLSLFCRPNATGNYTVRMAATDAQGSIVIGQTELTVTAAPPSQTVTQLQPASTSLVWEAVAAGLLGGAVVGGAIGWFFGRGRRPPPLSKGDPG
jgi:hypothetical protein